MIDVVSNRSAYITLGVILVVALALTALSSPVQTAYLPLLAILGAAIGLAVLLWLARHDQRQRRDLERQVRELEQTRSALQEDLSAHQARSRQLLQNTTDGRFSIDLENGSLLDINHRAEELLGYQRGDMHHLSLEDLFPRPHRLRLWRLVATVRRTGLAEDVELQFRRRDGSLFIGRVFARAGWLGHRKVVHGSFRDATPTVDLAIELRRHNRRLSLLNEISQRVAEGRDLPSTLEIVLDQVIQSLGVSGGGIFLLEKKGTEMQLAIHRDIPVAVLSELKQMQPGDGLVGKVAATGQPRLSTDLQKDHRRLSRAVAEDGWHAFLAVPMIAEETPLGVLFIFDRSDRVPSREDVRLIQAIGRQVGPLVKNAELIAELQWQQRLNEAGMRELERSRLALQDNLDRLEYTHRMLESLDRMKSTFLGLASHELRTPLTTILSGAELLQAAAGEQLDATGRTALEAILHGSNRLNHIVDDLLEAARLESRALYLARETFNPRTVIDTLVEHFLPVCRERQLNFRVENFPHNAVIRGDAHHLTRALSRLMENAVKFTPEHGRVWLEGTILSQPQVMQDAEKLKSFSTAFFQRASAERYLSISICDSGIGLDPSEHVRIFDKFYEVGDIASHSTSQAQFGGKGVGLGLTLAKGVIEAHDGMIWVESAGHEQGSRFAILLPLSGAEHNE